MADVSVLVTVYATDIEYVGTNFATDDITVTQLEENGFRFTAEIPLLEVNKEAVLVFGYDSFSFVRAEFQGDTDGLDLATSILVDEVRVEESEDEEESESAC